MVTVAVVFLLPISLFAQDCKATVYLESQTVKAGEALTIVAAEAIAGSGKQIVIAQDGRLVLNAARRIELNNGFKALYGSALFAGIVPCDPDGPGPETSVVYPNPADGIINIKAPYKMSALALSDMSGALQMVKREVNDTVASMDLSELKPGYYILEIMVDKSVVESIRIEKK